MDNSNSKGPVFGAIAFLIIVALFAGVFLFGEDEPDAPPVAETSNSSGDEDGCSIERPEIDSKPDSESNSTDNSNVNNNNEGKTPDSDAEPEPVLLDATISGITVDYFDDPVGEITVSLIGPDFKPVSQIEPVISNADGEFTFNNSLTSGGVYFVACLMEEHAVSVSAAFKMSEDKAVEGLKLKIYGAARVFGKVLNGEPKDPLEAVRVEVLGRENPVADRIGRLLGLNADGTSDKQGEYEVKRLPPGRYLAKASKDGWASNELNPTTRSIQEFEIDEYGNLELLPFVLIQAGVIEGRVLAKADNTPIAGATVELGTVLGGSFEVTTTNEAGEYRFANAPPTVRAMGPGQELSRLTVRATASGYAIGSRNVRVDSGETRKNIDLRLSDGVVIKGTVKNQKDEPIAGAKVYLNDTDFLQGEEMVLGLGMPDRAVSTSTNESGEYVLNGVPPGNASVGAQAAGYARAVQNIATVLGEDAV
ncbi:MAG: carboxypeptidase regulatory-like domain-containing protein, partial [Planctomycetota bacterium]